MSATGTILVGHIGRRLPEALSPSGHFLARIWFALFPFVTARRHAALRLERDRLIEELYLLAVENNRLEQRLRKAQGGAA